MSESFLFYDLETWGLDARKTRIAQFASLRTNSALEEIGEPETFFVRPSNDFLPSPESALVTGITPQRAFAEGLCEAEAFDRIQSLMSEPGTCTLGYNTLKFDDAFIRFGLYRNFHDAYEREYKDGNSRWDVFNVIRAVHALRPEGIQWRPRGEHGEFTSFKLEHLAEDNGLRIGDAHEALSDVRATLGLARRVLTKQPKLWHYLARLRDKRHVLSMIDLAGVTPLLHIAGHHPASQQHAAVIVPVCEHPVNRNQFIGLRVDNDPTALLNLTPESARTLYFTRREHLPAGVERPGWVDLRINESPTLIPLSDLRPADFERLQIDPAKVESHLAVVRKHRHTLATQALHVFAPEPKVGPVDADAALFEGFFGMADKSQFRRVRACPPEQLANEGFRFHDPRLADLFFRYRARNWPETLSFDERECWEGHRRARLVEGRDSDYSMASHAARVQELREAHGDDRRALDLLDAMDAWRQDIAPSPDH